MATKGVRRKMKSGPNKGDTHVMKTGPSGKPFASRVVKDVGPKTKLKVRKTKKRK